ncbi:FeoA domain-containing protein [Propioniciclava soli]|uniref:FeoA domain-containing protein n=1 Tax=Propioniciclava soli TaxID=2775081 RepID=A0ABZ3C5L5_9ACTN
MNASITLDRAPLGTPLVIWSTHPDAVVARRLSRFGVRRGARLTVVQKLVAGGRVVSVGGGRLALDAGVLAGVAVAPEASAA